MNILPSKKDHLPSIDFRPPNSPGLTNLGKFGKKGFREPAAELAMTERPHVPNRKRKLLRLDVEKPPPPFTLRLQAGKTLRVPDALRRS